MCVVYITVLDLILTEVALGFNLGFGLALGLAAFASAITGTGIGSVELTRGVNFALVSTAVTVGVSEIDLAAE
jgi:hypothetical protein